MIRRKKKPDSLQEAIYYVQWVESRLPKTRLQIKMTNYHISENMALVRELQKSLIDELVTREEFLVFIRGYSGRIARWHERREELLLRLRTLLECETTYYEHLISMTFEAHRAKLKASN